jgi:hypothetical protein
MFLRLYNNTQSFLETKFSLPDLALHTIRSLKHKNIKTDRKDFRFSGAFKNFKSVVIA